MVGQTIIIPYIDLLAVWVEEEAVAMDFASDRKQQQYWVVTKQISNSCCSFFFWFCQCSSLRRRVFDRRERKFGVLVRIMHQLFCFAFLLLIFLFVRIFFIISCCCWHNILPRVMMEIWLFESTSVFTSSLKLVHNMQIEVQTKFSFELFESFLWIGWRVSDSLFGWVTHINWRLSGLWYSK